MPHPRSTLTGVIALFTASVMAGACNGDPTEPPGGRLRLTNALPDSVVVFALDLETSHRVDPMPTITVAQFASRVIVPAGSGELPTAAIDGYRRGAAVRLFVYRVRNGSAQYSANVTRSSRQLASHDLRVEIAPSAFDH